MIYIMIYNDNDIIIMIVLGGYINCKYFNCKYI